MWRSGYQSKYTNRRDASSDAQTLNPLSQESDSKDEADEWAYGMEKHEKRIREAFKWEDFDADKQLGLLTTISRRRDLNAKKRLLALDKRLETVAPWKIRGKALARTVNSICISVTSYALLLSGITSIHAREMDHKLHRQVCGALGLSDSDGKEPIFVKQEDIGGGIRSVIGTHLAAVAR